MFPAVVHHADLAVLFVVIAILCFAGAAFAAYQGRLPAAGALVLVGILALIFGA